jgi:anti-sigma factor RsiW
MIEQPHEIDETDFQGFVDGHLEPDRRRAVMAHLSARPGEAARMGDYRALNEALHLAYDEVLHEPLPPRLDVGRYVQNVPAQGLMGGFAAIGGFVPQAAALVALAFLSGVAGWSLNDRLTSAPTETADSGASNFMRNAAHAHMLYAPEGKFPVEFGADQEDTLLIWLSERLGTAIRAPNLEEMGYHLVGGRLLPSAGQPAGQLMYEDPAAQRITLYIRSRWAIPGGALSGTVADTVSYASEDGVSIVYWPDGTLAYALIGQMDRDQLVTTARLVRDQLQIPAIAPVQPTGHGTEENST